MNCLVLKTGITIPAAVATYIEQPVQQNTVASLYEFETNITPINFRDQFGATCGKDLRAEADLHDFLGGLPQQDFYLVRVGDENGIRGRYTGPRGQGAHPG